MFDQGRPLPTWAVELALQPLLNIARQLIREGDGNGAHTMLDTLFRAVCNRTSAEIAGRIVNLRALTGSAEGRKAARTRVWAALLADGTRAFAQAGRWREAADAAAANRGVGARLLDGRQITILTRARQGEHEEATALIESSRTTEPWEETVQALLRAACHRPGSVPATYIDGMLTSLLALRQSPAPGTSVFRTRATFVGLSLVRPRTDERTALLLADVLAMGAADAYAAREVLSHPQLRDAMTVGEQEVLSGLVRAVGLGTGAVPEPLGVAW
ncbi:hypothetical protein ACIQU5_34890 [Streptomyces sp. NPDC090306]|uniref:hypothetical protein n=1 Tax=Streptomyces sp. NPDC090306 TaxID=3365961 RepID=UPI0038111172